MSRHRSNGRVGTTGRSGRAGADYLTPAIVAIGILRTASGIGAWLTVRSQLAAERIVVPDSGTTLHGRRVTGPLTAFAEANAIKKITLSATGGRTYGELPEGDPKAEMAMDASLLRSALFTSILAFGMAAAEVATGVALMAIGAALDQVSGGLEGRAA